MRYIIFSTKQKGIDLAKELKDEGEDVVLVSKSDFDKQLTELKNIQFEDINNYLIIFDCRKNEELAWEIMDLGFDVEYDEEEEEEEPEPELSEDPEDDDYEMAIKRIQKNMEILKTSIVDTKPLIELLDKKTAVSLVGIKDDLLKRLEVLKDNIPDLSDDIQVIRDEVSGLSLGLAENADSFILLQKANEDLNSLLKTKVDTTVFEKDQDRQDELIKKNKEEIEKLWKNLKSVAQEALSSHGDIVQGTTRLSLYADGATLNDVFNELDFISGSGITLTKGLDTTNRRTTLTIAAPGSTTDEKTKISSADTTAGYLEDKLVAGFGITLTKQNTGANENIRISTPSLLEAPVDDWYDPTAGLPVAPTTGDRYIAEVSGSGWTEDYIYEWDGDEWVEYAPEEGWMVWMLLDLIFYVFFSGGWMEVGSSSFWTTDSDQIGLTGDKTTTGNLTANSFITTGGTSSQFVKGDGSLDSSTYLTTETDPLSLHLDQTTPQTLRNGIPLTDWVLSDFTDSAQLVNKEYVDSAISFIEEFSFNNTASDIGGIYYEMTDTPTGEAESTFVTAGLGAGDDQALVNFATVALIPGVNELEQGIYEGRISAAKTAGTKPVKIHFEVYSRTTGGAETLITTSEESAFLTGSKTSYDLHASLAVDVDILVTDRVVVKWFANVDASGSDATVTLYAEGTTASHFQVPVSSATLNSVFVRQDGTKPLTANWDVGAFDITSNTFITNGGTSSQFVKGDGSLDSTTYLTAEADTWATVMARGNQSDTAGIIDVTSTEALLIRKDADGGDVFIVDSTNGRVGIGKTPNYPLDILLPATAINGISINGTTNPITANNFSALVLSAAINNTNATNGSKIAYTQLTNSSAVTGTPFSVTRSNIGITVPMNISGAHSFTSTLPFSETNTGLSFDLVRSGILTCGLAGTIANYGIYGLVNDSTSLNRAGASQANTNVGGYFGVTQSGNQTAGGLTKNNYGIRAVVAGNTQGTTTNYGVHVSSTGADTNWAYYNDGATGNNFLGKDNIKNYLGTAQDASIYYDGTNLVVNPKEVGSGYLNVTGDVHSTAFVTDGGTSSDFVKGDGSLDSSTYLTTVDISADTNLAVTSPVVLTGDTISLSGLTGFGTAGQVIKTNATTDGLEWGSAGAGYTNLTSFVDQTAWRLFYSNADGDVTELALGADTTVLTSNGETSAPTWEAGGGGSPDILVDSISPNTKDTYTQKRTSIL
jgi:hypothetical protein